MEKILSTKRKVQIRELSCNEEADCGDFQRYGREADGNLAIYGTQRSNLAFMRAGLVGGDFKTEINGSVPDSVIKELSVTEKVELVQLIQEYNNLGK